VACRKREPRVRVMGCILLKPKKCVMDWLRMEPRWWMEHQRLNLAGQVF
jgi:hypothetical protein